MITATELRPSFVAALCLALAACAPAPARPTYPDLHFTERPPLRLDVASVDVRNDYQTPFRAPNVEHEFPVSPGHAAENWARDRLKPVGQSGRALFIIHNAAVVETELPKSEGISSTFTAQRSERYDLTLQVTLQIIDATGLVARSTDVTPTRSQTTLDDITPNQRDQTWYDMTKATMADFDRQMESEIRNNFGLYYVR